MPEKVNWSFTIDTVEGPRLSGSDVMDLHAYDKVSVTLEPGVADVDVAVQPVDEAGLVRLLVIRASAYNEALTFSADGGTTELPLEGPVVLIGSGAVRLLADAPQELRLANGTASAVTVDILAGRNAAS